MSRKFIYAALALLTLGFTACTQEENFAPQEEPQEITILTRAADSGSATETFTGDFTLELWNDGVHTTHQMTYTEDTGWNAVKVDKLGTTVKALAHCGNTVNVTDSCDYSIALTEDQSTEIAFLAADVMTATGTVNQNGTLSLNFEHRLAMVTVTYDLADEFESTVEITPEVYSYTQSVFFNVNTSERKDVAWKEGDDIWVKAYKHEEVNADGDVVKMFTAIVSPNAYAVDDEFIRVTIGNQVLTAKMKDAITFTEGTHYTFNLKVGKDKVSVEQVSMNDFNSPFGDGWNNEVNLK